MSGSWIVGGRLARGWCPVDKGFDVLAEVWPSFGCVVDLLVALGESAVGGEDGLSEGEDDGVLDGIVSGAMVHGTVGRVA